ncbi:hypothetical protein [Ktedonospora formicarum]|uniref:Uncharacterized protein n=1 Tax=Ktedonospora formicarum TaxID=2778364 RepID=A0A8J3IEJ0_9CHLR|nr:hypothetical protein [Ktedonospora formicarum]GHO50524.1 hypothetical protein KSX_86870 [Ktedonospora formicarum]
MILLLQAVTPVFSDIATVLQHLDKMAPNPPNGTGQNAYQQILGFASSIQALIRTLGFTFFLIGIAVAGIMRMVSFGSDRRVALSNMALTAAVVGLIIMLMGGALSGVLTTAFPTPTPTPSPSPSPK